MNRSRGVAQGLAGLSVLLIGLVLGCHQSVAPADRVAEVNGEPIPYAAFEEFLRRNSVSGLGVLGSDVLSSLLDQFLDEQLLSRLASDRLGGLDVRDPRAAAEALLDQTVAQPDMGKVTAYYQRNRASFDLPERIYLRQLLFADREEAERIRQRWASGAQYAEILDEVAAVETAHAGEEGWFARSELPPAFADLLFALADGTVSEVLPADYGLHVFQVVQHNPAGIAPLAEVADDIYDVLVDQRRQEALGQLVAEARGRYNVRVFERNVPFNYLGVFDSNRDDEKN
jgi:parvulin-like peptidyl-prolyl isomerase